MVGKKKSPAPKNKKYNIAYVERLLAAVQEKGKTTLHLDQGEVIYSQGDPGEGAVFH